MKVLITGIHGFVGTNLVKALQQEHTLYGLDIVTPEKEGVERTYTWDETDRLPDVDTVIHLAGKAHDTKNRTDAQAYFDVNLGLTQRITDWFLASTARKLIHFSSVKAATDTVIGEYLTEEVEPTPRGPYGESKIAAEAYIRERIRVDKQIYILRPCMIHGPGNKGNFNLLYKIVEKGVPYPLGAFENRRSFTSIDNLSFLIEGLITQPVPSGIYNVADDESLSTNELVALISETLGRPERIWRLPPGLIRLGARIGTGMRLPFNNERLQKLTENYVVSNLKLKTALGIDKLPVSAREGFYHTIRSFKQ